MSAISNHLKVLLVDDEKDITAIIKSGLDRHRYAVTTFNDPKDAIAHYRPGYFDLIILDIRMPVIDGFKLAKQIWAKDEKARICFFSAFEIYEKEARIVMPKLKTYCFIKKPVTATSLAQHIESHFVKA